LSDSPADSIRRFDSKTNRTADSIRDSIRTKKNDSQVPSLNIVFISESKHHWYFTFSDECENDIRLVWFGWQTQGQWKKALCSTC